MRHVILFKCKRLQINNRLCKFKAWIANIKTSSQFYKFNLVCTWCRKISCRLFENSNMQNIESLHLFDWGFNNVSWAFSRISETRNSNLYISNQKTMHTHCGTSWPALIITQNGCHNVGVVFACVCAYMLVDVCVRNKNINYVHTGETRQFDFCGLTGWSRWLAVVLVRIQNVLCT